MGGITIFKFLGAFLLSLLNKGKSIRYFYKEEPSKSAFTGFGVGFLLIGIIIIINKLII